VKQKDLAHMFELGKYFECFIKTSGFAFSCLEFKGSFSEFTAMWFFCLVVFSLFGKILPWKGFFVRIKRINARQHFLC